MIILSMARPDPANQTLGLIHSMAASCAAMENGGVVLKELAQG